MNKSVVITSAIRSAIGSLGKSLKNTPSHELGSLVIKENIKESNLKENEIDEIIMGQVLTGGLGQNPARQACYQSRNTQRNSCLLSKSSLWIWN